MLSTAGECLLALAFGTVVGLLALLSSFGNKAALRDELGARYTSSFKAKWLGGVGFDSEQPVDTETYTTLELAILECFLRYRCGA